MADRWRYACPECGTRHIRPRTRKGGYRCTTNSHLFTEEERVDLKHEEVPADA